MTRIRFGALTLMCSIALCSWGQELEKSSSAKPDEASLPGIGSEEWDPAVRRYGVLYTSDGRRLLGRLVERKDETCTWQLVDGTIQEVATSEIARILPIPLDVTPHTYVSKEGVRTVLPLGVLSWADAVVAFREGHPRMTEPSNDPRTALGIPGDRAFALGHGGTIVIAFLNNALTDVPGPDLLIVEAGGAVEPTRVAISTDGREWLDVGGAGGGPAGLIDIGKNHEIPPDRKFHFVMIVDARRGASNRSPWPGADIDAVGAVGSVAQDYRQTYQEQYQKLQKHYQDYFQESLGGPQPQGRPQAQGSSAGAKQADDLGSGRRNLRRGKM